jgi:hypothetical protein
VRRQLIRSNCYYFNDPVRWLLDFTGEINNRSVSIKARAIIPAIVVQQQQQQQQQPPHDPSGFITALSSIAPALASTASCWGPAAITVRVFGAASGSSSAFFSSISKFR